jgi:hypothetical protein
MAFDSNTHNKLVKLLKGTPYRKVVSERAKVHANTVSNVLNGSDNPEVELEILIYAKEIKDKKNTKHQARRKAKAIAEQL